MNHDHKGFLLEELSQFATQLSNSNMERLFLTSESRWKFEMCSLESEGQDKDKQ